MNNQHTASSAAERPAEDDWSRREVSHKFKTAAWLIVDLDRIAEGLRELEAEQLPPRYSDTLEAA